jgi:glycosyltransferase involved in cell wall biosynthesis
MHHVVDPTEIDRSFVGMHGVEIHGVRAPVIVARTGLRSVQDTIARMAHRVVVHEPSFARVVPGARVIRHGVESLARTDRDKARARLGLSERPVALCFGFVAPYKGIETTLEAARIGGGSFDLVIAGGPHPRLPSSYVDGLERRFGDVARFTGFVPEADVPDWFSAADAAVFPYPSPFSSSGAFALALAYDTPALLSPALVESMDAPRTLTLTTQPRYMAGDLADVLSDPERLSQVRDATRSMREGRSWQDVAAAHTAMYEEVCDAERHARRRVRTR